MSSQRVSRVAAELNARVRQAALSVVTARSLGHNTAQKADVLVLSLPCAADDTGCMFIVPVAGRGVFTRAEELTLNGIGGHVGPAPNERLGIVDVLFTAAMQSRKKPKYTGLHLFSDLLQKKDVSVWCRSIEGSEHTSVTRLSEMQFARFTVYDTPIDPELVALAGPALFCGNRVLINGGPGIIAGSGARCTGTSLALVADIFPMDETMFLYNATGMLCAHNVTLALPLGLANDAEALLAHAARLASQVDSSSTLRLAASEALFAQMLLGGEYLFVDPGKAQPCVS